jgi:hypothetical protein
MPATPDTGVNFDALITAICNSIGAAFPILQTVESYDPDRGEFLMPALFVNIDDMEGAAEDDPATGQLALMVRFEAFLVLGFRAPSALRQAPALAAAIAHHIHLQRWGQPVRPAEVTLIEPDEFTPELDQFVVWRVDFQHVVHVGESVFDNDGTIPTQVLASWAPRIGTANESAYVDVEALGGP